MKLKHLFFLIALQLFISNGLAVFPHVEEWDSGTLAGWTANTTSSTVVYVLTGGNPNGYIETRGPSPGSFDIGALTDIADFTGDYAAAGITGASVDLNFENGQFDAAWIRFRYLDSTQNGWLYPLTDTFTPDVWQTYFVNFNPAWTDLEARSAGWLTDDDVIPSADPSVSFALTMATVYTAEVRISGDVNLLAGIDNFAVVPEPATIVFLGLGLFALRRKRV
jgi:hypothetical protein